MSQDFGTRQNRAHCAAISSASAVFFGADAVLVLSLMLSKDTLLQLFFCDTIATAAGTDRLRIMGYSYSLSHL